MAAVVRARNYYSPVSVEDSGHFPLNRSESRTSESKTSCRCSLWTFSLVIIGLCVLFLLGFCLGFYVRESQSSVEDFVLDCGGERTRDGGDKQTTLTSIHDDMMYRVRGENIRQFMEEFQHGAGGDPVSESAVERRLEERVRQTLQDSMLDSLQVEEYNAVVTYADPARPNHLQILRKNNNTVVNISLSNEVDSLGDIGEGNSSTSDTLTEDWKYPFVVHSPAGDAEGCLLYAHYGSEADLLVLQAKRVSLKNRIVLLRFGRLSLAEKVRNVASLGALGVLVYSDPEDSKDNPAFPTNTSFIPYASAAVYATEPSPILVPSIPVQTVSTDIAVLLLRHLGEEAGRASVPSSWSGGLDLDYAIGTKFNNGNVTVRLWTYNKQKQRVVRNIISNVHGTIETDRYILIGAPRASVPGWSQDALGSTAALLQIAQALSKVNQLKSWRPRRGIKIVSWGGADLGHMGMLHYIRSHHHLLLHRAVAYFDVSQLMLGDQVLSARVPPGLYQVLNEVAMVIPDPRRPDFTIQSSWQDLLKSKAVSDTTVVPLDSFHSDRSATPFLHSLGISTVSLKYRYSHVQEDRVSLENLKWYESSHHYKYHTALTRTLLQLSLGMVDGDVLPYSLSGAATGIRTSLARTSQLLKACSKSMQDLDSVLEKAEQLVQMADMFEEMIDIYQKREDAQGYRIVNDVKMLFERIFVVHSRGVPHHLLYPVSSDGSLLRIVDLCEAGDIAEVWDATQTVSDQLHAVLTEAISALRTTD